MTTEEVDKTLSKLRQSDYQIYHRYTESQMSTASDIWNRLSGNVDYSLVKSELKKPIKNYNKQPVFSPAMFVNFSLDEAFEIFSDYTLKVSAGSGFIYCGCPDKESKEDEAIRKEICLRYMDKPVTSIYSSVYPDKIIIKVDANIRGSLWDEQEYTVWKKKKFRRVR